MHLIKKMKYILCIIAVALSAQAMAQTFSYIYIQGDKQTPFYVKFEDEMLTRYGKNYYIISELAPGPIALQILFQQNLYPPQKFVIQVPERGFRGFLLTKKENQFFLYDIHQQFYLPAGNKAEDDHAPAIPEPQAVAIVEEPIKPVAQQKTTIAAKPKAVKPIKPVVVKSVNKATVEKTDGAEGPQFMDNIELGSSKSPSQGTLPGGRVIKNKVAIINSDCPRAIDNSAFQNLYKKVSGKSGTDRLKLLLEKLDNCYTTNQVRIMARLLADDAERFTYFKKVYAKVTDQSAFANLDKMLTSADWKQYFKELVQQ
jgi:hypothetical protein